MLHRVPDAAVAEGLQRQISSRVPAVQVHGEAAAADDERETERIAAGGWPFQRMADQLLVDLLDGSWHVRHGAAVALRQLLQSHAGCAGITFNPASPLSGAHLPPHALLRVCCRASRAPDAQVACDDSATSCRHIALTWS